MIDLSIVIVSWNTRDLLLACLASLSAATDGLHTAVWVVDNGSTDGSVEATRALYPQVQLIENRQNLGFAAANNQAIVGSLGRYALLLNSDTVAPPGSITQLVHFADMHPQAGVVGPMLINPDGSFQASFADFPSIFSEFLSVTGLGARILFRNYPSYGPQRSQQTRSVDYIPGACMLMRRAAVDQVGLMDEQYFMYSEETDWCRRMSRAGWQVWYLPEVKITHYGGQSTRQVRFVMLQALYRSKVRYFRKHHGPLTALMVQALFFVVLRGKWLLRAIAARVRANEIEPSISWKDLTSSDSSLSS